MMEGIGNGKILVLGGSRYFGKRLVNLLAGSGLHDVTAATRGQTEVRFDAPVTQLRLDRTDENSLREAAAAGPWDIVYDNICYSPDEALAAVRAFKGRVGQYILTSTLSVYQLGKVPLAEADFDPYGYELKLGDKQAFDYGEGKRLAEAALFQQADFPVTALRIPIVLGPDDYTRRLHFHVEHVQQGLPIGVPNLEAAMSFITSAETAKFLAWLGETGGYGANERLLGWEYYHWRHRPLNRKHHRQTGFDRERNGSGASVSVWRPGFMGDGQYESAGSRVPVRGAGRLAAGVNPAHCCNWTEGVTFETCLWQIERSS
ncbi:hypothetical protein HMSSN139_50790 [Paenibacillus sp. HMSSN-139]|nr:hypothetical protein HMSSN139_50790 [Paenibacillus sp. HMSSN-139]